MVQAEDIVAFMREKAYRPLTVKELEQVFGVEGSDGFRQLVKTLNQLEESGQIVRTRTNRYGIPERLNLIRGKLQVHPKGFGFVLPSETDHPDIFIHPNDMKGAMDGDTVIARINKQHTGEKRMEGEIVRIIGRGQTKIVGTFSASHNFGFVIPDDKRLTADVFIPPDGLNGAVDGQKVVVEIKDYPDDRKSAAGEVVEILGHKNDPGVDIVSIIRKYDLPEKFPEEVMEEARQVPDEIAPEEISGRRDLRERTTVTIDGDDAKDLDDAVSVEPLDNGHIRLGVHIADVSYYVREGSALDREAYRRGCSVYLVDRVIPMLPPRLSNGICSLNPHVDRLTMSCEMEIDRQGTVVRYDIFPSVIRSNARMTYRDVWKILEEEDPEVTARYAELVPHFQLMKQLALTLRQKRLQRGAIDFDFAEAKIIVDEAGKPTDIVERPRTIAEQIIEEFMLVANETVAEHFHWLNVPFIYRIHEHPDSEKLMSFFSFVTHFGYSVRGKADDLHPRALQQLLETVRGEPEETVISRVMLRSMQQARYAAKNDGHYGLAAKHYTHFTSPIRRYPDLVVHRIIREVLTDHTLSDERTAHWSETLPSIAEQSSERERVAVDAERETDDLKKAEFMLDKVGEEFTGIISSVTSFGIFVELENTVEGMVHVSYMVDDYYHFLDDQFMLVGERTGKQYRIGDEVKIRVTNVNVDERSVDFELVDIKPRKKRKNRQAAVIAGEEFHQNNGRKGKKRRRQKAVTPFYEKTAKKRRTRER
ncbi:ribonuclease R [Novibacillus thermophilus]|uniref:Ribonuclease R n=1 Tax=Novibacillus thermophilus TaxID=1471761 RepID=A0A1U9KAJ9_9BACL|nr:ribonuclease R [Novibacillus thermophilus]AQS57036.1 ribonuclease R [Novibacillus thermophilus]